MLSPAINLSAQLHGQSPLAQKLEDTHGAYDRALNCKRYAIVIGSVLIQLTLGTMFGFGNILPYIATYMAKYNFDHSNGHESLESFYSTYLGSCNWIYSASIVAISVGCMGGAALEIKYGPRIATFIGCMMVTVGVGVMYWAIVNLYASIMFAGILFGAGCGVAYGVPIVVAMRWFPQSQAKVTGIILMAFGAGPFVFNIVQTLYMNPYNAPLSPTLGYLDSQIVVDRVPAMWLVTAAIFAAMQIIGLIPLDNPPDYQTDGDEAFILHDNKSTYHLASEMRRDYYRPTEVCCLWKFWELLIVAFLNLLPFIFMVQSFKVFSVEYLDVTNDHFLSILGSITAIFSGLGRSFWGLLYDWAQDNEIEAARKAGRAERVTVGFNVTMSIMAGLQFVLFCSLPFIKFVSITTHTGANVGPTVLLCPWLCIIRFCNGGFYAFFPALLTKIFGEKYAATFIGFVLLSEIPATVLDSLIFTYVHSEIVSGWLNAMVFMGICAGVSLFIGAFFKTDPVEVSLSAMLRKKGIRRSVMLPSYSPNQTGGVNEDPSFPQTNYQSTAGAN